MIAAGALLRVFGGVFLHCPVFDERFYEQREVPGLPYDHSALAAPSQVVAYGSLVRAAKMAKTIMVEISARRVVVQHLPVNRPRRPRSLDRIRVKFTGYARPRHQDAHGRRENDHLDLRSAGEQFDVSVGEGHECA
jgi:hypothetical protein